jgi:mRNA interferase RelE/StbE
MAIWHVEFSKSAYKAYQKLEQGYKKIDTVLNRLVHKDNIDIKSVEGGKDIYRLRIGKYRMLIKMIKESRIILVTKIGQRGDVYK